MYARRVGSAWEVFAPAKLNLYLDVLGRRPDGFHELETFMAPVRLGDHLRWQAASAAEPSRFDFALDATTPWATVAAVPTGDDNLVCRAARLLADEAGVEPHGTFTLTKRVPLQAGMGGGSSDAAAALVLANAAWGLNYSVARLTLLAARLGSDVPFFLAGGSAVCLGRGEIVQPVRGLPCLDVVVVAPREGVSTAAAFQSLHAPRLGEGFLPAVSVQLSRFVARLQQGAVAAAWRLTVNRLQGAAERLCPSVGRVGTTFASVIGHAPLLTGSGSALFSVVHSAREARRAAALLASQKVGAVFATATCR